jgi:hypothetical protein
VDHDRVAPSFLPSRLAPCKPVASWKGIASQQTELLTIQSAEWRVNWKYTDPPGVHASIRIVVRDVDEGKILRSVTSTEGTGSTVFYEKPQGHIGLIIYGAMWSRHPWFGLRWAPTQTSAFCLRREEHSPRLSRHNLSHSKRPFRFGIVPAV